MLTLHFGGARRRVVRFRTRCKTAVMMCLAYARRSCSILVLGLAPYALVPAENAKLKRSYTGEREAALYFTSLLPDCSYAACTLLYFTISSFSISSFFLFPDCASAAASARLRDFRKLQSVRCLARTPRLCVCAPLRSIEIVEIARMYREHLHLGPHPQAGRARPVGTVGLLSLGLN